jgi:hypothetical protein
MATSGLLDDLRCVQGVDKLDSLAVKPSKTAWQNIMILLAYFPC